MTGRWAGMTALDTTTEDTYIAYNKQIATTLDDAGDGNRRLA